jgi:fructose-1,6-bisphosphatase II
MTQELQPDRNLALELVRATEAAAIKTYPFIGKGDKNAADGAAVDAMRAFLRTVSFDGLVVIGEGEKDNAPMLFNGERIGLGGGPSVDIAVDPVDGTALTAAGRQNAISVIAVSDRGSMLDASAVFKMKKLAVGAVGVGVCDIRYPMVENAKAYSKKTGKSIDEIVVAILDRDYNQQFIDETRSIGAAVRLFRDGDVAMSIQAAKQDSRVDFCYGIGGSPEGIVSACGVRAMGGQIQGILEPRSQEEIDRGTAAGLKFNYCYDMNEMVSSDNTFFVATGVTDGEILKGVRKKGDLILTDSIVIRGRSGTVRKVYSEYKASRFIG